MIIVVDDLIIRGKHDFILSSILFSFVPNIVTMVILVRFDPLLF